MIYRRRSSSSPPAAGAGGAAAQVSPPPSAPSFDREIWLLCLIFRAMNALLVQTYFNPDEHWQSLEVAHRIAFGYGHLTWEWRAAIRGYLHPLIFAAFYKILAFLRLDTPSVMMKGPRLLQSLFSSFGDVYLYKLSQLVFDEHVARWAISFRFISKATITPHLITSATSVCFLIEVLNSCGVAFFSVGKLVHVFLYYKDIIKQFRSSSYNCGSILLALLQRFFQGCSKCFKEIGFGYSRTSLCPSTDKCYHMAICWALGSINNAR